MGLAQGIQKRKFLGSYRNFENYRDLVLVLVQKEVKIRYKDKVLGYIWSIASPLAFAFVYYAAFKVVMRVPVENYSLILVSGLFPWQWFVNCVDSSPVLFVNNAAIIKKVNFPRDILLLATELNHMVHFILSLPVILLFMFLFKVAPTPTWIWGLPLMLLIQLVTVHGISLVLASLNVFLRDIERLVNILTMILFYFTPIIYTVDLIPPEYRHLIPFNPAAPLMINWRHLFVEGTLDWRFLLLSLIYALLSLVLGYTVYKKLAWRFAEVI